MPRCLSGCPDFRRTNREDAWLDIRGHYGPVADVGSSVYQRDITAWNTWANSKGIDPITNVATFGNWLIWKCSFGTDNLGNLPTRKREHLGISCIPCPYDSVNYDEGRSELWLGFVPTALADHGNHFMKITQKGTSWGFSCTFPGCPHNVEYGFPYFHA